MQSAIWIDSWDVVKSTSKIRISLSKSENILRRTKKLGKSLKEKQISFNHTNLN